MWRRADFSIFGKSVFIGVGERSVKVNQLNSKSTDLKRVDSRLINVLFGKRSTTIRLHR